MKATFMLVWSFLFSTAVFAADNPAGTGASFKGPLGLQMYSLRFYSPSNVWGKVDKAKEMGFRTIEGGGAPSGMTPEQYLKRLEERGIKLVSTGSDFATLKRDPDRVVAQSKELGVKYVMCSWIPHPRNQFTEKEAREAIEVFNKAGEKLRAAGITFAYHCHGYEFQPHDAGTLFDLIVNETRPEWVSFEMDVFWVAQGGADPAGLLKKYGSRFKLMHVKDLRKGAAINSTGSAPDEDSVSVGQGSIDWVSVLRAAKEAGVEHYFIEDEAKNAVEQIPQSLRYLQSLRW